MIRMLDKKNTSECEIHIYLFVMFFFFWIKCTKRFWKKNYVYMRQTEEIYVHGKLNFLFESIYFFHHHIAGFKLWSKLRNRKKKLNFFWIYGLIQINIMNLLLYLILVWLFKNRLINDMSMWSYVGIWFFFIVVNNW